MFLKFLKFLLLLTAVLALCLVFLSFYFAWQPKRELTPATTPTAVNQPPGLPHYVEPSEPVPKRIPMNVP